MKEFGKEETKIMTGVFTQKLLEDLYHLVLELIKDIQIFNQPWSFWVTVFSTFYWHGTLIFSLLQIEAEDNQFSSHSKDFTDYLSKSHNNVKLLTLSTWLKIPNTFCKIKNNRPLKKETESSEMRVPIFLHLVLESNV